MANSSKWSRIQFAYDEEKLEAIRILFSKK